MAVKRITGLDDEHQGFDELVADKSQVHIERMSASHIWMSVSSGGKRVALHFQSRDGQIWVTVEQESIPRARHDASA